MNLKGKVALITGGARGIGRAIAVELRQAGCKVIINYNRSQKQAEELVEKMSSSEREVVAMKTDVAKYHDVQMVVDKIMKRYHAIDILINNAGITYMTSITDMEEKEWDEVMAVNLKSVFNCCKAVIPHMIRRKKGKIINISGGRLISI